MIFRLGFFAAVVSLAGCASTGGASPGNSVVAAPTGDGDVIVGAIEDSSLPRGECGMILWTLEADRPAPIFRLIAGKGAEIVLNGELTKLTLAETSGAVGFGVAEENTLVAENIIAKVRTRFGLGFDGGSYLEQGLLTIESSTGWRAVIPAAGVAGCRRK
ncbi:MAG: hypothetical protein KDD85_13495 [Parvularculaceae bacterium]|nr:hypothetical protein [Parvularculaceae bacterium]